MIKLPRDMSADDVSQWLSGAIYLVRTRPEGGGPQVWRPARWIGLDGGRVVSELLADQRMVTVPHTSCAVEWPELGAFNAARGYAVHIGRIVERQYRRAYNGRALEITVPMGYRGGLILGVEASSLANWAYVGHLPWTGEWPASIEEAFALLESGRPTVAVNRRLIVAGERTTDKRMFYLDGTLVGNATGGRLIHLCPPAVAETLNTMLGGRYDAL